MGFNKEVAALAGSRRSFFKQFSLLAMVSRRAAHSPRESSTHEAQGVPLPSVMNPPAWLREGICAVWAMVEPLFVKRRGPISAGFMENWGKSFSEAAIKSYKEMGFNVVVVSLQAGGGFKAEADNIEASRKVAEIAHRYGMKVCGYVGSTLEYETLYLEEPGARNWEQVDERGRPMYYSNQTFRHAACRNKPGYRAFLRKVVQRGIEDVKLDMFLFDQLIWWEQPWSCHCEYCQEGLRAYLRKHYTDEQLEARFGFTNLQGIRVPDFNLDGPPVRWSPPLQDPLMEDEARFRCASLAEWWSETRAYIQSLNPEVALLGNPSMSPEMNAGFICGVDLQQLLPGSEFVWSEEGNEPRWTSDGRLVSRIRSYKEARSMGRSLVVWQRAPNAQGAYMVPFPEKPLVLGVAESLAYNDLNIGAWDATQKPGVALQGTTYSVAESRAPGAARGWTEPPPRLQEYIAFFRSHIKELTDTREVTDVAILRSFASIEFNPARSNVSTILFEQMLIQCKFPFGIIFDVHLKDLSGSKYKVLVLANQDALSDEQIDQIGRFVEAGGGLVATEETSMLTEWRRQRSKFGLAEVLGIDVPPDGEKALNPLRREFGKGRVVYLPRIEPAVAPPPATMSYSFNKEYWKLPVNYQELAEAVRWAGRENFSVEVEAPLWVTMELAQQQTTGSWLLHLLNFRPEAPIRDIPVRLRLPAGTELREAVLESPDGLTRQVVELTGHHGLVSFTVPELKIYDLVLLPMERS